MPVPKNKRKAYSIIVASLQNKGFSLKTARKKTDKALKDHPKLTNKKFAKYKKSKRK